MPEPIYVTRTRLPEGNDFQKKIQSILQSGWLTNGGQCVRDLEGALSEYLHCPTLLLCNNGTTALMLALQAASLRGKKVAVTAYTYVATLSALLWLDCIPVFIDIDPQSLDMSIEDLEKAFLRHPDIKAVLPVHIYGLSATLEEMALFCKERDVLLIYDGAQAFGSSYKGRSLLDFGDYSICSFHATKIFHTVEGGCVIGHGKNDSKTLGLIRAFGHVNDKYISLGINAKMSELHAAMGLSLLQGTEREIHCRRGIHEQYNALLETLPLKRPRICADLEWNYAYYPIVLPSEKDVLKVQEKLSCENIYPRRYFYPSLNTLSYVRDFYRSCPVSEDIAKRVLCLPLYGGLKEESILRVSESLKSVLLT